MVLPVGNSMALMPSSIAKAAQTTLGTSSISICVALIWRCSLFLAAAIQNIFAAFLGQLLSTYPSLENRSVGDQRRVRTTHARRGKLVSLFCKPVIQLSNYVFYRNVLACLSTVGGSLQRKGHKCVMLLLNCVSHLLPTFRFGDQQT